VNNHNPPLIFQLAAVQTAGRVCQDTNLTSKVDTFALLPLGIVTGRIDPSGFGPGHGRVRVGVKIFHPANDLDLDARSCRSQTYNWMSVGGDWNSPEVSYTSLSLMFINAVSHLT